MIQQNILDFNPPSTLLPGLGRRKTTAGIEYRSSRVSSAVSRGCLSDLGLQAAQTWQLEPYRGAEFESLETGNWPRTAKRRILVNDGLPDTVRRDLASLGPERLSITIGTRFDPYPAAEERFTITLDTLEALEEKRGLDILLRTRSPLVLRDRNLLQRLDMNHTVTVSVPIATLDKRLSDQLEPNAPDPAARLEIVRSLALDGIAVSVSCTPLIPAINNSTDELEPLFAASRLAGAIDLVGDHRFATPKHSRRVASWLQKHAPERAATVLGEIEQNRCADHLGTLERLRLTYGFPVLRAGRG